MSVDLPDVINVEPGVRKGRVPREGYQRGWGLQFGSLKSLVENEDLYRRALDASAPLTSWISPENGQTFILS
jgi:hypothetical protein